MNNFLVKVASTIEKFNMANKSERLLVCLSGGADSVTLLLCLYELGYHVCACHVNHHLRGEESDRDQHFCEKLCEKLGVELKVFHADVVGYCKEHSVSTEEGARKLRYDFFDSIGADTAGINDSAGSAAASLKETTEDLKYMRDLAEQEAINRFTTAEVKIDMTGMTNRIDSDMDLDGVLNTLTEGFAEALEVTAEGVHE